MEQVIDPTHVVIWAIGTFLIFVVISVLTVFAVDDDEEVRGEALTVLFLAAACWPIAIPVLAFVVVALCPFYLTLYVKRKLSNEPRD